MIGFVGLVMDITTYVTAPSRKLPFYVTKHNKHIGQQALGFSYAVLHLLTFLGTIHILRQHW